MPTITLLDLTMSRDTKGVVTARVDYTLELSVTEVTANVSFAERVALVRRYGETDRYVVASPGRPPVASQAAGDPIDRVVAVLADATIRVDSLGVAAGAVAAVPRSFTHVLTAEELGVLLEVGREHPYAVVSVSPTDITSDVQLAPVEIDVGDPVTFDAHGDPVGLAVDGVNVYVATAGGAVTKFDRDGNFVASFPVAGALSTIGFDGDALWVTARDTGMVIKLSRDGAVLGTYPTAGSQPSAIAFDPLKVWITHDISTRVARLNLSGSVIGTNLMPSQPRAIAATSDGRAFVLTPGGVLALESNGTVAGTHPVGQSPAAIVTADGMVWTTDLAGTLFGTRIADGATQAFPAGPAPRGLAIGGGAVWVAASGSGELVKYDPGGGGELARYAVGSAPDAVVFDGDRVFVANRSAGSGSVSIIPA